MGFAAYSTQYDWERIASYKKKACRAEGGMVDLSIGSPVDPVPDVVREALAAHADGTDAHGYPATKGGRMLREAITRWFENKRQVDLAALHADVVPTMGSKEAVALMASLLHLGPGDVVVQPAVSYPTYEIGTQLAGAKALKVPDVSDVRSWVGVSGVKAVWVNSPCNPTGEVLSPDRLAAVVQAARSIGAVVLSDECYALLNWAGGVRGRDGGDAPTVNEAGGLGMELPAPSPSMLDLEVCSGSAEGVLVLYSLSKQSNMAGYRTALVAGDMGLVEEQTAYRRQIGQIIPGPVQAAMAAALDDEASVSEQHNRYRARLVRLVEALREYGYDARMPQGGLYVWVKAIDGDCWSDMERLADIGIVPSPGEFYGAPDRLRFSVTATDDSIDAAVDRLRSR